MRRRLLVLPALLLATFALALPASTASLKRRGMIVGIVDDAQTLYGDPARTFPILKQLRVQAIRVNLYWGGRFGVARRHPTAATNPNDRAYNWKLFDRTVMYAHQYGIKVLFTITATPGWANGGGRPTRAPSKPDDLRRFAFAAAKRYSGTFKPAGSTTKLPPVRLWLAWNEPNNPINLSPQYRRVRGRWVVQSAVEYAKICTAVWKGVHQTGIAGEKVACGATAPQGNNAPRSSRPSVSPIAFLQALKKAGLRTFDAYAHHPYYGGPSERPSTPPRARSAVTLGNLGSLVSELTRLYGPKRVWITEYGYQTRPPDRRFGVSWANQARYLSQAYAIARANPRVDMMLWFLLRDDSRVSDGWQSGFFTSHGVRKPAFDAFRRLPR